MDGSVLGTTAFPSLEQSKMRLLIFSCCIRLYFWTFHSSDLICQNLMRLTELSYAGNALTLQRHLVKDALVNVDYEPNEPGDFRIVMSCNSNFMLTTTELLPPFAAEGQTETTRQMGLPSIYPLKPALNLEETNIYDWETNYRKAKGPVYYFIYICTLFKFYRILSL